MVTRTAREMVAVHYEGSLLFITILSMSMEGTLTPDVFHLLSDVDGVDSDDIAEPVIPVDDDELVLPDDPAIVPPIKKKGDTDEEKDVVDDDEIDPDALDDDDLLDEE